MNELHRESVEVVRRALLEFHKRLIEAARVEHEKVHGRVETSGEYLTLLTTDEAFLWLRPISELILALDELGGMPEASDEDAAAARFEVERILSSGQGGSAVRFQPLLEISPDAVISLARLQQAAMLLPMTADHKRNALDGRRASWKTPRRTRGSVS